MNEAEKMDGYLQRVQEIEAKEVDAPWRKSPFFQPLEFTMLLPPCGCTVEGDGNIPSPLRIKFCATHARVQTTNAQQTEKLRVLRASPGWEALRVRLSQEPCFLCGGELRGIHQPVQRKDGAWTACCAGDLLVMFEALELVLPRSEG